MIRVVRASTLRRLKDDRERFRVQSFGNRKRVEQLLLTVDLLRAELDDLKAAAAPPRES